jgi:farnesol kinase
MAAVISPADSGLVHDLVSSAVTAGVALGLLRLFEELAKRGVFEQVSQHPSPPSLPQG